MVKADWLSQSQPMHLLACLVEYRYLVGRFPQWLALTIGHSQCERVRQLLLPNLIRESGSDRELSHLSLLDGCILSCGAAYTDAHIPRPATRCVEEWFFRVFASGNLYSSLCVLGPGTEAISWSFLQPLCHGLKGAFGQSQVDLSYFDVHRPDNEDEDARMIQEAMHLIEQRSPIDLSVERAAMVNAAIDKHQQFWDSLRAEDDLGR